MTASSDHDPSTSHERDWLRDVFDSAPDGLVLVDSESGRIHDCNATLLKALGRTREDLTGSPIEVCYHASCGNTVQRVLRDFKKTGEGRSEELVFVSTDGRETEISLRVTAYRGGSIWRNNLHRRDVEALRIEAKLQKTQRLESLALLAGGIAHDFNNLLVGILGNAGLALMTLAEESPARTIVEAIETASLRAAELTRQMLAYSGKGRFEVKAIDLSTLVSEMTHLLQVTISKKNVLRLELSVPGPTLKADATQIRQVVMNLITNAAEAIGDRSGSISISTGSVDADAAYLEEMECGEEISPGIYGYLEVSDTGIGMSADTVERMFDPFFSTKHDGHGLGLAAMQGIVRGHGGAIRVYTELGKGTSIKLLLPLAPGKAPAPSTSLAGPRSGRRGLILVVDDEEQVRAVSKQTLELAGYKVITCEDGREGVEVFRQRADEIEAVLLDMTMPHMDGKETFRLMSSIKRDVRVVLMSGYNEQDATSSFSGKGLAGFIQKPFRTQDLLEKISDELEE